MSWKDDLNENLRVNRSHYYPSDEDNRTNEIYLPIDFESISTDMLKKICKYRFLKEVFVNNFEPLMEFLQLCQVLLDRDMENGK